MNKIIPIIVAVIAVASGLTLAFVNEPTESSTYLYVPSDITKANPTLNTVDGSASLDTYNPSDVKDRITNTVIGKVKSVGDPIYWTDKFGDLYGAVPVTIKVKENIKGTIDGKKLTFYLHGWDHNGKFYLVPYEAEFEIGEKVLVHLSPIVEFEFQNGTALYPILGEYGKYKIGDDDKAYNKNHKHGKNLDSAKNESK